MSDCSDDVWNHAQNIRTMESLKRKRRKDKSRNLFTYTECMFFAIVPKVNALLR